VARVEFALQNGRLGGACKARFTLNRETATSNDNVELLGLDRPLVQEELGRWRIVPPEDLGIAVAADVDDPVLLSFWMVEASGKNGGRSEWRWRLLGRIDRLCRDRCSGDLML
jgi:hypothetical protein